MATLGHHRVILLDLSKAIDCIPNELLMVKMHAYAYGFDLNSLALFYSYLKNWKQNVKINNTCTLKF